MDFSLLTIYYEDHGGSGIAYDLTVNKRFRGPSAFAQLKQFVEMLKAHIPASDRVYDPQTKVWTIGKTSFDSLLKIMQTLNIRHIQGSPTSRYGNSSPIQQPKIDPNNFFYNTTPASTIQTRESISESLAQILGCSVSDLSQPLDVVKKLYRKKALELHPDRNNGDGSRMSELNSLWSVYNAN